MVLIEPLVEEYDEQCNHQQADGGDRRDDEDQSVPDVDEL